MGSCTENDFEFGLDVIKFYMDTHLEIIQVVLIMKIISFDIPMISFLFFNKSVLKLFLLQFED